jgi:hypothetical protein
VAVGVAEVMVVVEPLEDMAVVELILEHFSFQL